MLAVVIDARNLACVGKTSRPVKDQRVFRPRIPQCEGHFDKFVGSFISGCVIGHRLESVVARFLVEHRGHDVPSGPSAADVVERCQKSCRVEWRVKGRGDGGDQADVRRRSCHGCQRGDRFEKPRRTRLGFSNTVTVSEENGVQLAAFGDLGERLVIRDVTETFDR